MLFLKVFRRITMGKTVSIFLACLLSIQYFCFPVNALADGPVGFYDDMENGMSKWNATGFWHQVEDGVSPYANSHSKIHSWWFGQDATGNYDNRAIVSGSLITTTFYVPQKGSLAFWSWESTENKPGFDTRTVYLTNDNGTTWIKIYESGDNSSTWHKVSVDLSDYGNQAVKLKFAFDTVNKVRNNYRGWYIDDVAVFSDPVSDITAPVNGDIISGQPIAISGRAVDNSGSGLNKVEVSINGGAWRTATGTANWSYIWTLPADGINNIKSRATDNAGNIETPAAGVEVTVDNTPPSTNVTSPANGAFIKGTTISLSGTASDGEGTGVAKVEISSDGGKAWDTATGTTNWDYDLGISPPENYSMWRVASAMIRDVQSSDAITVRVKHLLKADGSKVRVGFVSGPTQAISIDEAYLGNDAGDGAVSGNVPLTFGGNGSVTVPGGETIFSDPVTWNAIRGSTVVVTTYGTGLSLGRNRDFASYYEDGDVAGVSRPLANKTYLFRSGYDIWNALVVEVLSEGTSANENVLLLGDSITLGAYASYGARYWAGLLGAKVNVFNAALGGTTAAYETGVLAGILGHGIKYDKAIVSLGTNDIGFGYAVDDIKTNLCAIYTALESQGITVIAGNITPRSAVGSMETARLDINDWLGTLPCGIKGVIDFDAAVRDPASPSKMLPGYDDGYGLHPSSLGHAAMYGAIDKENLFTAGLVFDINARAIDIAGNVEDPYQMVRVTVDNSAPTSTIENISAGATLTGTSYKISGTSEDGAGCGVNKVEVSTNAGITWNLAEGASAWSYGWILPVSGNFTVMSRAADRAGNEEIPDTGVSCTVVAYGTPELPHFNWNPSICGGSCEFCHRTPATFLPAGIRETTEYCRSCHNAAGISHERDLLGSHEHATMVNVTTGGCKTPTYGNITASEYNNQPFSRLSAGNKITCVVCHNVMRKTEDYGRSWEYTATSDHLTYKLQWGGWDMYGYLVPKVYRDTSLFAGPAYVEGKKAYLVDPSEYTYDETAGTITFKAAQPSGVYIYVGLDYQYLRASSQDNRLCSDCHAEATHKGNNCLSCHQAHNTDNIAGIRGTLRTTDRSECRVNFQSYTGVHSFADGDKTYDGICEVCHTLTKYYRRDGTGFVNHSGGMNYDGKRCTACHSHSTGFAK